MKYVFQVNNGRDYNTAKEAIEVAERKDEGLVIKFLVQPNVPDRMPKFLYRSICMWSFERNRTPQWMEHYIHDAYGNPLQEGRPN